MNSSAGRVMTLELVAVAVVLPLEGDHAVFQFEDAPVGDGDAVGVAAEILQDVLGSAEGGFGVDHPFLLLERRQVTGKGDGIAVSGARSPKNWSLPAAWAFCKASRNSRRKSALRTLTGRRNLRLPEIQRS